MLLHVYVVNTTAEGFRGYRLCRNEHEQNVHKHEHKHSSRKSGTVNITSGYSSCMVSFKFPIASRIGAIELSSFEFNEKCVTVDLYRVQFHSSEMVNIVPSPYIKFYQHPLHNFGGEPCAQRDMYNLCTANVFWVTSSPCIYSISVYFLSDQ